MPTSTDQIEKQIDLNATTTRIWRALTNAPEFGEWFGASLTGEFAPAATIHGKITSEECKNMSFAIRIERMEPEKLFSFRWHPLPEFQSTNFQENSTLVEFKLKAVASGTRLTVIESGFDNLPPESRAEAFARNEGGWAIQLKNIEKHVA